MTPSPKRNERRTSMLDWNIPESGDLFSSLASLAPTPGNEALMLLKTPKQTDLSAASRASTSRAGTAAFSEFLENGAQASGSTSNSRAPSVTPNSLRSTAGRVSPESGDESFLAGAGPEAAVAAEYWKAMYDLMGVIEPSQLPERGSSHTIDIDTNGLTSRSVGPEASSSEGLAGQLEDVQTQEAPMSDVEVLENETVEERDSLHTLANLANLMLQTPQTPEATDDALTRSREAAERSPVDTFATAKQDTPGVLDPNDQSGKSSTPLKTDSLDTLARLILGATDDAFTRSREDAEVSPVDTFSTAKQDTPGVPDPNDESGKSSTPKGGGDEQGEAGTASDLRHSSPTGSVASNHVPEESLAPQPAASTGSVPDYASTKPASERETTVPVREGASPVPTHADEPARETSPRQPGSEVGQQEDLHAGIGMICKPSCSVV